MLPEETPHSQSPKLFRVSRGARYQEQKSELHIQEQSLLTMSGGGGKNRGNKAVEDKRHRSKTIL